MEPMRGQDRVLGLKPWKKEEQAACIGVYIYNCSRGGGGGRECTWG